MEIGSASKRGGTVLCSMHGLQAPMSRLRMGEVNTMHNTVVQKLNIQVTKGL